MGQPAITIIKSFEYRGVDEEWSNQYHLSDAPSTDADWRTVVDDMIALEIACYSDRVTVLRAYCYTDSDNPSVYTYDLALFGGTVPGELTASDGITQAGDAAGWVRWWTGRTSSSGKKIYLRKYFHDVHGLSEVAPDTIHGDWVTQYQGFATTLLSAFSGSISMVGPDGTAPPGPALSGSYVTTRTLKRRGRRP